MHQFTISAAAATVFAVLLASASAQADILNGASTKNGNQCFKFSQGQERDSRFGSWNACPQPASAPAAPRQLRKPASR